MGRPHFPWGSDFFVKIDKHKHPPPDKHEPVKEPPLDPVPPELPPYEPAPGEPEENSGSGS